MEYKVKSLEYEVKDVDEGKGIVKFAFANFGSLDSDGDIIQKGAYNKTILENGPKGKDRIYHYKNHNSNMPVGKPTEIYEEGDFGVMVSKLSKNSFGRDTLIEYQEGIIKEHSQGFFTVKEETKNDANYIQEVILVEASSLTKWAANENTPVFDLKEDKVKAFIKEIEKRSKMGFTDEYHKNLEELLKVLKHHLEPGNHSKPEEDLKEFSSVFNNFKIY